MKSEKVPVFDLGNVVVRVEFSPFIRWMAEHSQEKDEARIRGLHDSSLYYDFEFGNISAAEFIERTRKLVSGEFSDNEFAAAFCEIFPGTVDGVPELLQELGQQREIFCLSNTNELHLAHIQQEFPVMRGFQKVYSSFELRKRKPYPAIYKSIADRIGTETKNLVFFDDVEANVEGARKAGVEAHLFTTVDDIRRVLLQ